MKADGVASRNKTFGEVFRITMSHDTVGGWFSVKNPFTLVSTNLEEKS